MNEQLLACPFCGAAPYTNVNGDPTGFGATIECIAGKCSVNPRVHADAPTLGQAEEWAAKRWQARALCPALDVVLEAVEALPRDGREVVRDAEGLPISSRHVLLAMLHALRDAHSPTDTPSGSGAESEDGETERGS